MSLWTDVLDLVYPRECAGCGASEVEGADSHFCWECMARWEIIAAPYCAICGDPFEGKIEGDFACAWCRESRPHFDRARSAARYRAGLRQGLWQFKYGGCTHLARDLSRLLAACVQTHYGRELIDAVAAVPLHPKRERERTYNQAELLAVELAGVLGVPRMSRGLQRIRATATQTDLSAAQRKANVKGAFGVKDPAWVQGRRILLVDDVMTTGATVNQCAATLRRAGAARVLVVTVARG